MQINYFQGHDPQKSWPTRKTVWAYDDAGNIISKTEYSYTQGNLGTPISTIVYGYSTGDWKDLLIAYNGRTITYDAIGNPLSDGIWSYTWEHGRQLKSMSSGSTTWQYSYDVNGMRCERTDGTNTYKYIYNGDRLVYARANDNDMYFTFDDQGRPVMIQYNGSRYHYALNLQGDVIGLVSSDGAMVVSYTYDAWGNILTTTGSLASTLGVHNPLRYRGYVYDTETGLYYLQSRYYNPEIGRFISADSYASTGQGVLGNNT